MMGTTEINNQLDVVFDTMGTDDVQSNYFQKNSLLTLTTGERGGDRETMLNSSRNLELISSSDSDDDEDDSGNGRSQHLPSMEFKQGKNE